MKKFNSLPIGALIGLLGPLIILYGIKVYNFEHMTFDLFLRTGFSTGTITPWLKLATIFNLAPFFYFINDNKLKIGQGIILSTLIYGAIIVYFTLQ